jgi:hypothetical protein
MEEDKRIKTLRTFFRVSNAAFTCVNTVSAAISGRSYQHEQPMATLHRLALTEIEKEKPNMEYMDKLLEQMELEAERNSNSI